MTAHLRICVVDSVVVMDVAESWIIELLVADLDAVQAVVSAFADGVLQLARQRGLLPTK
jgi:hypothetical protein